MNWPKVGVISKSEPVFLAQIASKAGPIDFTPYGVIAKRLLGQSGP